MALLPFPRLSDLPAPLRHSALRRPQRFPLGQDITVRRERSKTLCETLELITPDPRIRGPADEAWCT